MSSVWFWGLNLWQQMAPEVSIYSIAIGHKAEHHPESIWRSSAKLSLTISSNPCGAKTSLM